MKKFTIVRSTLLLLLSVLLNAAMFAQLPETFTNTAHIDDGGGPDGVAVSADGTVFSANGSGGLGAYTYSGFFVCEGDVTLSSQADVDAFACTEITGNLTIGDPYGSSNITNLNALSSLTSVGLNLNISEIGALTNFDSLYSLTSVGGSIVINENDALTNLDGLSSLTSVGLDLAITANGALTNFDSLYSLTSVGNDLNIRSNGALTNMDGLSSLASVGGALLIQSNSSLTNLDSLSSLTSVDGYLYIQNNNVLTEFCGLYPLLSVGVLSGDYEVSLNAENPSQQDIIDGGACSSCEAPTVTTKDITLELDADGNASIVALDILEPTTFTNLTSTANWLGFIGVFVAGDYVHGDVSAIGGVKSTIDAGADEITLQPNFNPYYPESFDDPILQGSTYIEEFGTLAGGASFSFTGYVTSNTLDPRYEAYAFIRIFNAAFEYIGEIRDPLIATNNFSVQYNNTLPDSYIFQYGFTVEGTSGAYDDETSLGNAVVQGMTLNIAPYSSCGLESVVISQTEFDCSNIGLNEVTVTATDINGEVSTGTAEVMVEDNESPVLTAVSTPITLWPPNHKYETISMSQLFASVGDNCSELSIDDVYITSVSSDEPENGSGDGNTVNDIVIDEYCSSVKLRKERDGGSNGRVYTINLAVDDGNGNTGTAIAQVYVPVKKKGTSIDDGEDYSESCTPTPTKSSFLANATSDENQLINYPNPFKNKTTIEFTTAEAGRTSLKVYNSVGYLVATLYEGYAEAGQQYKVDFEGSSFSKGVYFYHLQSDNGANVMKKMILMK